MNDRFYLIPEDYEAGRLVAGMGELYQVEESGADSVNRSCLDTFDWRLFENDLVLCRNRGRYALEDGVGRGYCTGSGSRKNYPFWRDLEPGKLRDLLAPVADIRALMVQFELERQTVSYRLLNRDEKTVLRLARIDTTVSREGEGTRTMTSLVHIRPLRGYDKPYRNLCSLLEKEGFREAGQEYSFSEAVLALFEIDPVKTSSKFVVTLEKDETVGQAVRDICLQLKGAMLLNFPGIQDDVDSEFLHDFRVAVRRTRSLLTLLKKQLPKEEIRVYQDELRWLGSVTGPTRDLDVYLLKRDEFKEMLPAQLHSGLDGFFQTLESQRKNSLRLLRRNLASERFGNFLKEWEAYLDRLPERGDYPPLNKLSRKVAVKIIRKRFERMLQDGGRITPETADEKLHELRIEAKKFRYILEFFRSLFDVKSVDNYLKQMKRLQNNLGDFNDLSVQIEMLTGHLESMAAGAEGGVETGAALGGLIVHLQEEQKGVRRKFEKTFAAFASLENIELLESIFNGGRSAGGRKKGGST